jgi:hypothetical protein
MFAADENAVRRDEQGTEAGAMAGSRIAYLPDTRDGGFMRVDRCEYSRRKCRNASNVRAVRTRRVNRRRARYAREE